MSRKSKEETAAIRSDLYSRFSNLSDSLSEMNIEELEILLADVSQELIRRSDDTTINERSHFATMRILRRIYERNYED